jgi:branched-chain amino acid transport system permease protein
VVFATRVLIYALIASSLNLLIGYGGMVSSGPRRLRRGRRLYGRDADAGGIVSAWLLWPAVAARGALLALLIGA